MQTTTTNNPGTITYNSTPNDMMVASASSPALVSSPPPLEWDGDRAAPTVGTKRPIEDGTTKKTDLPGTVQPPKKKKMRFSQIYSVIRGSVGEAPTPAEMSTSSGTECYGIMVSKPDPKSYISPVSEGATFDVTSMRVILGHVDPAKNVLIDEATQEVMFEIPDPVEYAAALAKRKETNSKEYFKVEKTEIHRVAMNQVHKISIPNRNGLPGVRYPSIVRISGLTCKGRPDKKTDKIWYDLNATDVRPLDGIGCDPKLIARYLRDCGVVSNWYHESPFGTEAEIKASGLAGKWPLIIPIVRLDDPEMIEQTFSGSQEFGFIATVRSDAFDSSNFFYLPATVRKNWEAKQKAQKGMNIQIPNPHQVNLENCHDFGICAKWPLTITQWDHNKHSLMSMDSPLRYETSITAYGAGLWSTGVSHPAHWAVMRFHVPFMGGVLLMQENRIGTYSMQNNITRHHLMSGSNKTGPASLGVGMRQIPRMWSRGVIIDVPSYLAKYALRCSFETATVLMGAHPGDVADTTRKIIFTGRCGEEQIVKRDGNVTKVVGTAKLDFKPEGFVCLNAITEQTDLRQLNQKVEKYYVLTTMSPRPQRVQGGDNGDVFSAMISARRQAELVDLIADQEVLEICHLACLDYNHKVEMETRAANTSGASPSLKAAGEWLTLSLLGDPGLDMEKKPPYLVFAIYKQPSRGVQERIDGAYDLMVRGWQCGPTGAIAQGRAPTRINAPATDELDLEPQTTEATPMIVDTNPDTTQRTLKTVTDAGSDDTDDGDESMDEVSDEEEEEEEEAEAEAGQKLDF